MSLWLIRKTGGQSKKETFWGKFSQAYLLRCTISQWSSAFFAFSIITEGTTEKVFQFIMPLKSICNKTLVSLNKNVFLNTAERSKQENVY